MPDHRSVLHVDMDAFFASVEQQTYPFLRGRPIGVCGDPEGRTVVAAASYEAKRRGVKTAMTVPEARRLCPEIILVPGDPAKYVDTSVRILAIYTRYTDLVEVFSIDEAFLDVTNSAHLHGGAEPVARAIKREIRARFGITCSVGVAPNKLLAKLAGELDKPDGLTVILPEDVPALLERTPVEKICGIGPKTKEKLNRLGVRTCAELGRYPEKNLRIVFGINGIALHNIGVGRDDSPVQPCHHEPGTKSMGHSFTLERDTRDRAEIKRHLLQLSEQVGRRLRRERYAGRTIAIVIRYEDFETVGRQRSLRNPTGDGHRVYAAALKLFDELYREGRAVRLLGVSVSNLVRDLAQLTLVEDRGDGGLFAAADALNDRFGEFSVARARLSERRPGPRVIPPSWRPRRE
ncbi:DNA polymerase IV [candidate division WOR-3 bacterium]|nr:DNA polymerase IV [candidate division WOR-3 bacterium]